MFQSLYGIILREHKILFILLYISQACHQITSYTADLSNFSPTLFYAP